jgi:hypothetical protein
VVVVDEVFTTDLHVRALYGIEGHDARELALFNLPHNSANAKKMSVFFSDVNNGVWAPVRTEDKRTATLGAPRAVSEGKQRYTNQPRGAAQTRDVPDGISMFNRVLAKRKGIILEGGKIHGS